MKRIGFTLICLVAYTSTFAQWDGLGSGIKTTNRAIWDISVVDENIVWGITANATVFSPTHEFTKTVDGGKTWQSGLLGIESDLFPLNIFALNDSVCYVTTADENKPISGKIYKTINGGTTWTEQTTAFTGLNETPAGIHFWNEKEGVAFGATGHSNYNNQISIYKTINGGTNWTKVDSTNISKQLPGEGMWLYNGKGFFSVIDDHIWFVTNGSRIFKSTNRGDNWTAHDTKITNSGGLASIAFKNEMIGIVTSFNPNIAKKTIDGGLTWDLITIPTFPVTRACEILHIPGTDSTFILHDAFYKHNSNLIWITTNDGNTWDTLSNDLELVCIEFHSPKIGFAGGIITSDTSSGMYKWVGEIDGLTSTAVFNKKREMNPLIVYPNPAKKLAFLSGLETVSISKVELVSIAGKRYEIKHKKTQDYQIQIDLNGVLPGIYFLVISSNENKIYKRINVF